MRTGSTHRRQKKVCLHASCLGGTAQIGRPIHRQSQDVSCTLFYLCSTPTQAVMGKLAHQQMPYGMPYVNQW